MSLSHGRPSRWGLGAQLGHDLLEAIGSHARHGLRPALGVGQAQRDGDVDEVDVCDVGEQLSIVVCELAKGPHNVEVGVGGIGHTGLYNGRPWIDEEGQLCTNAEPNASASYLRDVGVDRVAGCP